MNADTRHEGPAPRTGGYAMVAIAPSAGGIRALATVLGGLPESFPVPVVVVQHLDPHHETVLADLMASRTGLDVRLAEHGGDLRPGTVRMAPPDRHVVIGKDGRLELTEDAPRNFVRPSADLLLRSAAEHFGAGVLACVLTGAGRDGAEGARAVRDAGGTMLVQDPATAEFRGMPSAAVAADGADEVLPLEEIAGRLMDLVGAEGNDRGHV